MRIIFTLFTVCFLHGNSFAQSVVKTIESGGMSRQYRIYVPASYDGSTKVPLVFCMHGLGDNMDNFEGIGMTFVADTANFIVITPQAATDPLAGTAWNSGAGANFGGFEYFPNENVDDVGFVRTLIDSTSANYNIDARRVYACGFSMGGYMTNRLACELNDRIAAFGPVAATIGAGITCTPGRALPIITVHGTSDATVTYDSASFGASVPQLLAFWANNNGCDQVDSNDVPDIANDGYTVEHFTWGNCSSDGALEHFKVYGADHTWLGPTDDIFYTTEIWKFFMRYEHPNQSLGMNEEKKSASVLSTLQNPFNSNELKEINVPAKDGSILISDLSGRTMIQSQAIQGKINLSLDGLATGTYVLTYTDSFKNKVSRKIVVE